MAKKKRDVGEGQASNDTVRTFSIRLHLQRHEDCEHQQPLSTAPTVDSHHISDEAMQMPRRASTTVLELAELLESIFVCLPIKDIWILQQVARRFRDVAVTSIPIQQKLFMRTYMPRESWDRCCAAPGPHGHRCLHGPVKFLPSSKTNKYIYSGSYMPAALCPLIMRDPIIWRHPELPACLLSRLRKRYHTHERIFVYLRRFQRKTGSYRSIHLSDPPSETLHIDSADVRIAGRVRTIRNSIRLHIPGGITFGDVVDAAFTNQALFF